MQRSNCWRLDRTACTNHVAALPTLFVHKVIHRNSRNKQINSEIKDLRWISQAFPAKPRVCRVKRAAPGRLTADHVPTYAHGAHNPRSLPMPAELLAESRLCACKPLIHKEWPTGRGCGKNNAAGGKSLRVHTRPDNPHKVIHRKDGNPAISGFPLFPSFPACCADLP